MGLDTRLSHQNNFTLIRWLAATSVLVSHAFPLAAETSRLDVAYEVTGREFGWYAVNVFFVVSGFLVTESLLKRRSVIDFLRARALRIFPGLITMLLVMVGVLGLAFGSLPYLAFWRNPLTWSYLVGNATLLHVQFKLPGVLHGQGVNGSLWTLPSEVFCYLLLAVVGVLGGARHKIVLWGFIFAALAIYFGLILAPDKVHPYPWFFPSKSYFARLGFCFLLGVMYSQIRNRLPLRIWAVPLSWGLVPLSIGTPFLDAAITVGLAYTTLWFAYCDSRILKHLQRLPDYSYGIYIYAFPTQRCVYYVWPHMTPVENILVAGTITITLAGLSWHLVEERALAYVSILRKGGIAEHAPQRALIGRD